MTGYVVSEKLRTKLERVSQDAADSYFEFLSVAYPGVSARLPDGFTDRLGDYLMQAFEREIEVFGP